MAYKPINLAALQIGMESGGQQFGKDGKPLTSPKGAVGVAQVMPGTGPEAAALAGLPWDEKRYKNDRDYNMRLGDAYQGHLNKIFNGHELAATAAYNAGPTRVLRLRQQYGDSWAEHLPDETKQYVKRILGVDVGGKKDFASGILSSLGITPHGPYEVGKPGSNETASESGNFPIMAPGNEGTQRQIGREAGDYKQATATYSDFLERAIAPLHANSAAVAQKAEQIASTKQSIFQDFSIREADLEAKIKPLQERRQAIVDRIASLDAMSPLERRIKSAFNSDYDPRVLRGRLERVEMQLEGHQKTYSELNTLRSGVAALSVDANSADVAALDAQSHTILADAQLLGQVAGAVHSNLDATLLPGQLQADQIRLQNVAKAQLLGNMTVERVNQLYQQAQTSPDGTITIDGTKLTVGELQTQARNSQQRDLSFRSMKAAYAAGDMQLAQEQESQFIDHMTPEQVNEALKAGGKYQGHQLSLSKLTAALAQTTAMRNQSVNEAVNTTAVGFSAGMLKDLQNQFNVTTHRATEMFGNTPGEMSAALNSSAAQLNAWSQGLNDANSRGVGKEYIASTVDQISALRKNWDDTVTRIASKWGGGKPELAAVAENYIRGNPLSGDAALKGLIVMARSGGVPNGTRLQGPALAAWQTAQAVVKDWDSPNPQAGDSLQALMENNKSKKDTDLMRVLQTRVAAVYANGLADSIMTSLPALARQVRDPANPTRPHPFAAVNRDDFIAAIRHGDSEGFAKAGQELGINAQQAQAMFNAGTEKNPLWDQIKKAKGYTDGDFATLSQRLQAQQMVGTLQALDASHSAHPGFSPAKAFVSFLNSEEAQAKIGQPVQSYGNSGFGSFLISSSSGGGFQDAFSNYSQGVAATYQNLHSDNLRARIKQQRSIAGDPWTRMNAVLRAADLTPQEAQVLLHATKPLVNTNQPDMGDRVMPGIGMPFGNPGFDAITNIVRNHRFEDKQVETIRKKAASQWDAMEAVVGRITDGLSE